MRLSTTAPVIAPELVGLPVKLQAFIQTIEQATHLSPQQIRKCMSEANFEQADLMAWADFDHPITHSYGRKPVYVNEYLEVMVMSWVPGDFSTIHDHGIAQWGAVQVFGQAEHSVYALDNYTLRTVEVESVPAGTVQAVHPDLIHQMGNPGDQRFLSLHVYGREEPAESITGDARLFDLLEGCAQFTNGGVFFCLPEEQISGRQWGIRGDRATTLRHHQQMRDRILRIFSYTEQEPRGKLAIKDEMMPKLQQSLAQLNAELSILQSI